MSLEEKQGKRAVVASWKGNTIVYPLSGRGLLRDDVDSFFRALPPNVPERELGVAVYSALAASRFLAVEEAQDFLRHDAAASERRVARCASAVGAESSAAFVAKALKCFVDQRAGVISLTPTRRIRGPAWEAIAGTPPMTVSAGLSPEDLGNAVHKVLSQCAA